MGKKHKQPPQHGSQTAGPATAGAQGHDQGEQKLNMLGKAKPTGPSDPPILAVAPKGRSRHRKRSAEGAGQAIPPDEPARKRRAGHGAADRSLDPEGELEGPVLSAGLEALDDMDGLQPTAVDRLMQSVVKVYCAHSEPNYSLPWQRKRQYSSTSSGFIAPGRRILTNAHCVEHHTQVKVRQRGSDTKYLAQVLAVGPECDVALLTVQDEAFWRGSQPIHFGELPRLQDSVTVIGFPIGGDTMSVTSGVVSRIEVTAYVHGGAELLGIQIDAAINSGNSGGPAFNSGGECVGIAFQSLRGEEAENIGYVIPVDVVQHFLRDFDQHGAYTGFPSLGVAEVQKLESPSLRASLGMKPGQKGVLIRRVAPTAPAAKLLAKGDILMGFEGTEISHDCTVPFRSGERISYTYLISRKFAGEHASVKMMRNGRVSKVQVELQPRRRLVPVHTQGRPPPYFIIGGLVFTQVTVPYLRSEYGKDYDYDAPNKLVSMLLHGMPDHPDQQVVVLGQVLASELSVGYEDITNVPVLKVNGQEFRNLEQLVRIVEGTQGGFLKFDLEYNFSVVLETEAARQATPAILAQHCVPADRSVQEV